MTARVTPVVGLVALALVIAVSAGAGTAVKRYSDAAGDARGAGPDITSVAVSHDAKRVTFTVRFAVAPPLGLNAKEKWVDMLIVGIDVPPLGITPVPSSWKGVDYYFGLHGNDTSVALFARTAVRKFTRLPVVVRGASVTVSVPRARLGNPKWFGFAVAAGREAEVEAQGSADYAPAKGVFRYVLVA
jgi:hypothetical protein